MSVPVHHGHAPVNPPALFSKGELVMFRPAFLDDRWDVLGLVREYPGGMPVPPDTWTEEAAGWT